MTQRSSTCYISEHHHRPQGGLLDRWCKPEWPIITSTMRTRTDMTVMKMRVRTTTFIAYYHPPWLEKKAVLHISQSEGFTYHYWLSLVGIEPGVICMSRYRISLMISGFKAHHGARGWWGLIRRSSVWCACQDYINFCRASWLKDNRQLRAGSGCTTNSSHKGLSKIMSCWKAQLENVTANLIKCWIRNIISSDKCWRQSL